MKLGLPYWKYGSNYKQNVLFCIDVGSFMAQGLLEVALRQTLRILKYIILIIVKKYASYQNKR